VKEEYRVTVEQPRYPPKSIVPPLSHRILRGDVIQLYCEADASPTAKITWFYNNRPIRPSDMVEITEDDNKSWLTLKNPLPGLYTAVATNELGSDEASALVEIEGIF